MTETAMKKMIVLAVESHRYPNVGHGFTLSVGTTAEGWLNNAVRFWERHIDG